MRRVELSLSKPAADTPAAHFPPGESIPGLLAAAAAARPEHVFLRVGGAAITYAGLARRVAGAAASLHDRGIRSGQHVAVMLTHHVDHVLSFFALMHLGATMVPVNPGLKGLGLAHVVGHSGAQWIVAEQEFVPVLREALGDAFDTSRLLVRDANAPAARADHAYLYDDSPEAPILAADERGNAVRQILYTSGTTGPAKGVVMTDLMLRAAALGSQWIGDIGPGSVLHFWDPIHHVFGSEVLVLALRVPVTLVLVPRFSASRFWDEAREHGVTHVHFVGGVLQLLLKQPERDIDRDHGVRIAWGGGCPLEVWRAFEQRFGVTLREGYGMTETSSFCTINVDGRLGSIGKALAYFDVELVDEQGAAPPPGVPGEIRVREREPGVMLSRYHGSPEAIAEALRGPWLYTGDLATQDADGFLYFKGRKKDSIRRRGENISAWEVERAFGEHPDVEECALIAVRNEFGDEELKLFVKSRSPRLREQQLVDWATSRLAGFQIPRFVQFVDTFPKTPTERIRKQLLSTQLDDCWDREKSCKLN